MGVERVVVFTYQTNERSTVLRSRLSWKTSSMSLTPSFRVSPVLNTAALFCMILCILFLTSAVLWWPLAWRSLSKFSIEAKPAFLGKGLCGVSNYEKRRE